MASERRPPRRELQPIAVQQRRLVRSAGKRWPPGLNHAIEQDRAWGMDVPHVSPPASINAIGRQLTNEGEDKPTRKNERPSDHASNSNHRAR